MRLGFIGFGEVGYEMAKGFATSGLTEIVAYDVMQGHPVYGKLVAEEPALQV